MDKRRQEELLKKNYKYVLQDRLLESGKLFKPANKNIVTEPTNTNVEWAGKHKRGYYSITVHRGANLTTDHQDLLLLLMYLARNDTDTGVMELFDSPLRQSLGLEEDSVQLPTGAISIPVTVFLKGLKWKDTPINRERLYNRIDQLADARIAYRIKNNNNHLNIGSFNFISYRIENAEHFDKESTSSEKSAVQVKQATIVVGINPWCADLVLETGNMSRGYITQDINEREGLTPTQKKIYSYLCKRCPINKKTKIKFNSLVEYVLGETYDKHQKTKVKKALLSLNLNKWKINEYINNEKELCYELKRAEVNTLV